MKTKDKDITLAIEGMTCSNCALGISRSLEQKGLENVAVNFSTGEASFTLKETSELPQIIAGINSLGYKVIDEKHPETIGSVASSIEKIFYFSLIFTVPLFSHMFLPFAFLHNPIVQLLLCLPVFIIGISYFGRSAWASLKTGVPNMDVLIMIGTSAAFLYSLAGTFLFYGTHEIHNYLFYETAATIISLVLLGNVLEHRSVKQTTSAIKELNNLQVTKAKKVELHNNHEHIKEINADAVRRGDILLVNTGDKIPVDGAIVEGSASIDESMITGESIPVEKTLTHKIIGGTIIVSGSIKMKAESVGKDTVLSKIIELVKKAQQEKPDIQKLGDKVSAVFVPVVLLIAVTTFVAGYFLFDFTIQKALMNSIAVLVISCPCAMGLATPTAVMVGIGRAAKEGILIKGGNTLEQFAKIKTIVFDKTGVLTTGNFEIKNIQCLNSSTEKEVVDVLFNLEQYSSHPIAKSIVHELKEKATPIALTEIKETKGLGIQGKDNTGNNYKAGSFKVAEQLTSDDTHQIYLLKNDVLIAFVDLSDSIKTNAKETIHSLHAQNIETIMLSGDSKKRCEEVASQLHIDKTYSEQHPDQKLNIISSLVKKAPTAMVGDGINDAPALATATVGVSLSNATQVAIQSAQIILLKGDDLAQVNKALQISKHTLLTIKQNLFWAFFYNIIAIPIAAMGFLNPMVGAFAMAFSDVIVIGNSIRLKRKKID